MKEPTARSSTGSERSISPLIVPAETNDEISDQIMYASASRHGMPKSANFVAICNALSTSKMIPHIAIAMAEK